MFVTAFFSSAGGSGFLVSDLTSMPPNVPPIIGLNIGSAPSLEAFGPPNRPVVALFPNSDGLSPSFFTSWPAKLPPVTALKTRFYPNKFLLPPFVVGASFSSFFSLNVPELAGAAGVNEKVGLVVLAAVALLLVGQKF